MEIAYSVNDVQIRLTEERWEHIVRNKPYMETYDEANNKNVVDYDHVADVLYLHFEEKPASTHSEMGNNGIILDYRGKQLVGLTILEASKRNQQAGFAVT